MTVASQRMGMLTGIGNLSHNTVSGANTLQNLSGTVAELFIPVLQQEGKQRAILFSIIFRIITTRQRNCGKVMFSQVCVILSRRGMPGPRSLLVEVWVCLVLGPFRGGWVYLEGTPPQRYTPGMVHPPPRKVHSPVLTSGDGHLIGGMLLTGMLPCSRIRLQIIFEV